MRRVLSLWQSCFIVVLMMLLGTSPSFADETCLEGLALVDRAPARLHLEPYWPEDEAALGFRIAGAPAHEGEIEYRVNPAGHTITITRLRGVRSAPGAGQFLKQFLADRFRGRGFILKSTLSETNRSRLLASLEAGDSPTKLLLRVPALRLPGTHTIEERHDESGLVHYDLTTILDGPHRLSLTLHDSAK